MKKIVAFLFIMLLLFSNFNVFAATNEQESAGSILQKMGILKGYVDGTLQLDSSITRAEFAMIISRLLGYDDMVKVGSNTSFVDIKESHWAYNSIQISADNGYIKGYFDGTFLPGNNINYAEAITIMVRILGYNDNVLEGEWPNNYINKANELGVLNGLTVENKQPISRGDVAILVVNCLPVVINK